MSAIVAAEISFFAEIFFLFPFLHFFNISMFHVPFTVAKYSGENEILDNELRWRLYNRYRAESRPIQKYKFSTTSFSVYQAETKLKKKKKEKERKKQGNVPNKACQTDIHGG